MQGLEAFARAPLDHLNSTGAAPAQPGVTAPSDTAVASGIQTRTVSGVRPIEAPSLTISAPEGLDVYVVDT
jgi:hypothetical protein